MSRVGIQRFDVPGVRRRVRFGVGSGRMRRLRRRLLHVHRRGDRSASRLRTAGSGMDGDGSHVHVRANERAGRTGRRLGALGGVSERDGRERSEAPRERVLVSTRQSAGSAALRGGSPRGVSDVPRAGAAAGSARATGVGGEGVRQGGGPVHPGRARVRVDRRHGLHHRRRNLESASAHHAGGAHDDVLPAADHQLRHHVAVRESSGVVAGTQRGSHREQSERGASSE